MTPAADADGLTTGSLTGPPGPLLTAAEERRLGAAARRGDRDARDRLVRANLRLVAAIARRFAGRGLATDDLVGEGNLGLIRAATAYDPAFGTRFSTYAAYWIKEAIGRALMNTAAPVRLPAHMFRLMNRWRHAEQALAREGGRPPTRDQVADRLGLTAARRSLAARALAAQRLRAGVGSEDGGSWWVDELAAPGESPGAALEAGDARRDLLRRLDRLGAREREVLTLRFGLGGGSALTLKEVGRRMGATRECARKLERAALARLADALEGAGSGAGQGAPGLPGWDRVREAARGLGSRARGPSPA